MQNEGQFFKVGANIFYLGNVMFEGLRSRWMMLWQIKLSIYQNTLFKESSLYGKNNGIWVLKMNSLVNVYTLLKNVNEFSV